MSSSFNGIGYSINTYEFQKGDEIEMVVKGPLNTITERYVLDGQLDFPTNCGVLITGRDWSRYG